MKAIGGYFNLETIHKKNIYIHENGIHLNSGRNALEYILRSIPTITRIWIPYYTCDVVLEPIKKIGISYCFYRINERLELANEIQLLPNEYILITNYFGLKDTYINELAVKYGKQLIIDNAQALFAKPIKDIKTIYSPRKFVGIPDGGIVYMENGLDISDMEQDISYNRCSHLLKRLDLGAEAGYLDFKENSHQLVNQPIKQMSRLTKKLLENIDFETVKKQRQKNFKQLHDVLSVHNLLYIPEQNNFSCPMVYPFYTKKIGLKKYLIKNRIFVATYWPNVLNWCKEDMLEYDLTQKVIAIPIDQRYGYNDINYIIKIMMKYGK